MLLAWHHRSGDARSREMALDTLDAMARGGMWDHLGGGFARYSVDGEWRIPHFEKMLYDNAQLVPVYVQAWQLTGAARFRRIARDTCDWVLREMTHPEGGFASAQDADSEGEEGRFYGWTPKELRDALGLLDGMRVATLCQVTDAGTFEHGTSVLRVDEPLEDLDPADRELLAAAFPRLKEIRDARVWPGRDDKVITAWNALMISALAKAGAAFGDDRYVDAAEAAAEFLLGNLVVEGRLQRTWKDGRAHVPAFADDHAALCVALLDLWEATHDPFWLAEANGLATRTIALFWDDADSGLFYTGHDAEALVSRSKRMLGGAEPSANGLAALAFARLAVLSGRDDLGRYADTLVRQYQPVLARAPRALGAEALAAEWRTGRTQELVIVGERGDARTRGLLAEARKRHRPFLVTAVVPPAAVEEVTALLPWIEGKGGAEPTAYLCEGRSCRIPVRDPAALGKQLGAEEKPRPVGFGRDRAPALPSAPALWLNTDRAFDLDALKGQVVVLDFWTYCCVNCMHVLPELAELEQRFAGESVVVVGVHSAKFPAERELDRVRAALGRHDVRHPVVHDPDHALWEQYAVKSWPTVMVLDPEGRIAWRQPGEADADTLTRVVRRLLKESAAAGTLAAPVWQVPDAARVERPLAFPGKVAVWPPTAMQEQGADPLSGDGRLYIADTGHHRVIEAALSVGPDGWPAATVARVWGSGEAGLADGGAESARFREPQGLDRTGTDLYVADTGNHAIRHIDLDTGRVRTVAGTGQLGRSRMTSGPAREVALRSPWDVAAAGVEHGATAPGQDLVFVAMAGSHQIWALVPSQGRIAPFAGTGAESHVDGPPQEAALAQPSGLSLFGRYLFFADSEVSSIRFVDLQQRQVGTIVGAGLFDWGDVNGRGAEVRLQHPLDVTTAGGDVWVADTFNGKVKRIDLKTGETTTAAEGLSEPGGITRLGGYLVVADTNAHRLVVMRRATGEVRELTLGGLA